MYNCENCNIQVIEKWSSGRFCSIKCSRSYSTKSKRKEINEKVSKKLIGIKHKPVSDDYRNHMSNIMKELWKTENFKNKHRNIQRKRETGIYVIKKCKKCEEKESILKYGYICEKCKHNFEINYRRSSYFKFNVYDYPNEFNLTLLNEYGWYHPTKNPSGVSRDHIISVKYGFENSIPLKDISHPANCKLVIHKDNQRKNIKNEMTYDELKIKIEKFKTMYPILE